jgi:hypothetical protein
VLIFQSWLKTIFFTLFFLFAHHVLCMSIPSAPSWHWAADGLHVLLKAYKTTVKSSIILSHHHPSKSWSSNGYKSTNSTLDASSSPIPRMFSSSSTAALARSIEARSS